MKVRIVVPQETVNDETVLLQDWLVKTGEKVKQRQGICCLETSKATIEIESPADGYVHYGYAVGRRLQVGELLAVVTDTPNPQDVESLFAARVEKPTSSTSEDKARFSKPALKLIEDNKLDESLFSHLSIVRAEDVRAYIARDAGSKQVKVNVGHQKIILVGAGRHAKTCIDILRQTHLFEIIGLVGHPDEVGRELMGVKVIASDRELNQLREQGIVFAINAIGAAANHIRRAHAYNKIKSAGFTLPNLIHPRAVLEPSVRLGEGNQIMANAVIGSDVTVGNNCLINSGAIVSHCCCLADNVHLTPGAILAGNVKVGENTLVGMGVTIYQNLVVGSDVVVVNGVNVIENIPDKSLVKISQLR